jgi:NAD(P)-dependent dehydrogenase (short-subunit alcohol dehydrogenase family)
MTTFNPADIPDVTGKTGIVTGANSGTGQSVARDLAAAGARLDSVAPLVPLLSRASRRA